MLDIPENAVSLAEYKRKNLLNKEKLNNQEEIVDTSKNSAAALKFGNKSAHNNKKEKALKVNTKRDNQVEENLNDLISKKIIQSTHQRDTHAYESNRNRDEFRAGNDRRRNDFNGERGENYNATEDSNRNYNRNYVNHKNNYNENNNYENSYNNYNTRNYTAENNQEGSYSGQYAPRDNFGSRRGRGGNHQSNRNPLRNVIFSKPFIFN